MQMIAEEFQIDPNFYQINQQILKHPKIVITIEKLSS